MEARTLLDVISAAEMIALQKELKKLNISYQVAD